MEIQGQMMPPQKLSSKLKGDKWREQCVDAIDSLAQDRRDGRTSFEEKQINYDLLNSKIDKDDFKYVLDPYSLGDEHGGTPAKMRDMNLIRSRVMRVANEDLIRPFDFTSLAVNGGAITAIEEKKHNERMMLAKQMMAKALEVETEEEFSQYKSFQEIDKSYAKNHRDEREKWANAILQSAYHREHLKENFHLGFIHGLVSSEEIYYIGQKANDMDFRVVYPANFTFEKSPENTKIEDAGWAVEERYMSMSEIVDEFSDELSSQDIADLDEGNITSGYSHNYAGGSPEFAVTIDSLPHNHTEETEGYYRVVICTWKSLQEIKILEGPDETGTIQSEVVDESFKLTPEQKEAGFTLDSQWINTVWQGTKIGGDKYVNINPLSFQIRNEANPAECKLPYVGGIYNNIGTDAKSFVGLLKDYEYLHRVVWYRLENELAKAQGKKMIMDMAQLPTSKGIDFKKWLYYFQTMGIGFINSHEEGETTNTAQAQVAKFNQFQALDMTLSNVVAQYIGVMDKIENLMDGMCGLSPQILGSVHHMETAKGTQTAVTNSSYIIENYFLVHNDIKKRALSQYIEVAKYAYSGGKTIHSMTDDGNRTSMMIDGKKFADSSYNTYVTDSSTEKYEKDEIKGLAQIALQQDKANLSDAISIIRGKSSNEIANLITDSEEAKFARDAETAKQEQEAAMAQQEAALAHQEKAWDREDRNKQLDRENEIIKAGIVASGFDDEKDRDGNGVNDALENSKLAIQQSKLSADKALGANKLAAEALNKEKDRELKREEMVSKEKIAREANETALKNKTSGEK